MKRQQLADREMRRMLRHLNRMARSLGSKRCIRPDEYIDATSGLEELDPYDVYFDGCREFGIPAVKSEIREHGGLDLKLPRSEWLRRYAHTGTWRGLAAFLLERLDRLRIEEATVLGKRCGPAGAFLAIRIIAKSLGAESIAPRECVDDRLSGGDLRMVWARLQWLCGYRLPRLRHTRFFYAGNMLILCAIVGGLFAVCSGFGLGFGLAVLMGMLGLVTQKTGPTPPRGITSFRDLAHAVWLAQSAGRQRC